MSYRESINRALEAAAEYEKRPDHWKMNITTLHDLCVELNREELYIKKGEWMLYGFPIQLVMDATDIILETLP